MTSTRHTWLRPVLYMVCGLTDFAAFVVVFTVSRGLAERGANPMYLGIVGAGLAFTSGIGSLLGGWLAHKVDGRRVFLGGAAGTALSIAVCRFAPPESMLTIAGYWSVGIGLGFLYPPLVGLLNQGENAHANRRGVSRTLILFCLAWNVGMMCGQLTAGSLFLKGTQWAYGAALLAAVLNFMLAWVAVRLPSPPETQTSSPSVTPVESLEQASAFKRLSWLANIGGMFGGSLVIHLLPDLAVAIGIPPESHGQLLAGWRAVIILTYLLMHQMTFWHYRLRPALAAQALGALGLVVISRANSSLILMIGLALLGQLVGYNYFAGLFYSTAGSAHNRRALAAGIHEATLAAGMAVGTIVGGALGANGGHRQPYLFAAGVVLVLIVVQAIVWRNWKRMRDSQIPLAVSDPLV